MSQGPNMSVIARDSSGAWRPGGVGAQNDFYYSEMHGRKYTQAVLGNIFVGAAVGVTTSAGLAATYTGLCLSNPADNTKNVVLRAVGITFGVVFAAFTTVGLIGGWAAGGVTVHTTPLVPRSGLIGSGTVAATAKLDSACTIVGASVNAPGWLRFLAATPAATSSPAGASFEIDGGLVIPPGGYVAIGTSIASPASSLFGSMEWEEVPVLA